MTKSDDRTAIDRRRFLGMTGIATLALGSVLALAAIIAGGVFALKYLEEGGFGAAVRALLARA